MKKLAALKSVAKFQEFTVNIRGFEVILLQRLAHQCVQVLDCIYYTYATSVGKDNHAFHIFFQQVR